MKSFEQKSNNRFELADKFIKDSKQAKIIASKENPEGIRDFLKKIGSNFQIQNQNISFSPRGAWQTLSKSALSASPTGEATAPQVRKTSENSEIVNWRVERDGSRTPHPQSVQLLVTLHKKRSMGMLTPVRKSFLTGSISPGTPN